MKKLTSKKGQNKINNLTVYNLRILFALIIVLIVLFLFKFFFVESIYTTNDFSIKYPKNWLAQNNAKNAYARSINLTGKEGSVQVVVGQGINTNCNPSKKIILKTFGGEVLVCSSDNETGLTYWGSVKNLQNTTFSIIAHINSPINENKNIILDIISSLKK